MITISHPQGLLVVTHASQALLNFQLVSHWGNRITPHPSPETDVGASALFARSGFDDSGRPIEFDKQGRPVAFEALITEQREMFWRSSIHHAEFVGRYIQCLVSRLFSDQATYLSSDGHARFIVEEHDRQEGIRRTFAGEPRYRNVFSTPAHEANCAILGICDGISDHLIHGGKEVLRLPQRVFKEEHRQLELSPAGSGIWRLSPWPLIGRRLRVGCEGTLLGDSSFADGDAFRRGWLSGRKVWLSWTLLPTSGVTD